MQLAHILMHVRIYLLACILWFSLLALPRQDIALLIQRVPLLSFRLQINAAPHIKWMEFPLLPQLPKLFELVETFMNNKAMWIPCNCNIIEAITIETNLN